MADFDPDQHEGQIDLAAGARCALGQQTITNNQIGELTRLTRDPEVALSALFARLVESREATVGPHDILAAERTIVSRRFGGQSGGYAGALTRGRATRRVARDIVGDELRRRSIQARLTVPAPSGAALAELQLTYGSVPAREVQVEPSPSWLPDGRGVALALDAPPQVFTAPLGRAVTVRTFEGVFTLRALADTAPLAAIPRRIGAPGDQPRATGGGAGRSLSQLDGPEAEDCARSAAVPPRPAAAGRRGRAHELPAVSDADRGSLGTGRIGRGPVTAESPRGPSSLPSP